MPNDVPLDGCDVQDKETLAVYRFFRRQWLAMVSGDDEHAISHQITKLFSADLEFRTINFSRKLSRDEGVKQNGLLHEFVDRGFVAHQALTIRRLTEEYDGSKRKAVFSLPRVISEIEEQAHLVTREMYVCVDGDRYDWSVGGLHSTFRHRAFDELAKVGPDVRARSDQIHPDCFRELRARLKSSEAVRRYANKFLAHAADPSTRSRSDPLTLERFDQAYRDLAWLTRRLSATFLYGADHVFLPMYNYDVLGAIGNPVCPVTRVKDLEDFWSERYKQLEELERGER